MPAAQVQTLPITEEISKIVEKKFPELSEEHCPDRSGEFCELTDSRCTLSECPKIKETTSKRE